MGQAHKANSIVLPLIVSALAALTALLFLGGVLISSFDERARLREEEVIKHGMSDRIDEVARQVVPQTVWDDAVAHLDNTFDRAWAQSNIIEFLSQAGGFHNIFVLDRDNRPLLERFGPGSFENFAASAHPLVGEVRKREVARVALGKFVPGENLTNPIHASAIANIAGQLRIVSAALVQSDFNTKKMSGPRAPIVIASKPIDAQYLKVFGERFMLDGLQAHLGNRPVASGRATIALKNSDGKIVGALSWIPQRPGAALLAKIGPWVTALFAGLLALAYFLFRRAHRIAEELIGSEARAAHLAYHDSLTGHANRVLLGDRLGQALGNLRRDGTSVAILCVDLDRFKDINDTYGHQTGDEVIKEAARRMAAECRASDVFARVSGDEFAIVASGLSADSAARLATRMCQQIALPFEFGSARLFIGCSVGIAIVQDPAVDAAEALRQADIALYRTKETAKGLYSFFEPEMDAAIRNRRNVESDLRKALATGQLRLAYQPQVDSRGNITAVEALMRWDHPERGEISPTFFIPIAEQCGLMLEVGMFALTRAFEDSHRWPDLRIAINVSATQLRDRDFIDKIVALAIEKNVSIRRFDLEITEGILLGDDPETHDRLQKLRQLGFNLALDDFGTGYSSLSYLQRYPINKIKIDRSFVSNLGIEAESDAVVTAIVKMARALKLGVIAEGVETVPQVEHLTAAGCSTMQGYLYSKPVEANEIDRLMGPPRRRLAKTEVLAELAGLT